MNPRDRSRWILVLVACLLGSYLLETHRFGALGGLLALALAIILGRGLNKGKLVTNPFGENRDYSLRPAGVALLKALLTFAVAATWAVTIALAVRHRLLPDNGWIAYGLLGFPLVALIALMALFLAKAVFGAQYGNRR
jgi:uncharacterized membrane protein HdeD (DUF308 family)